MEYMGYTTKKSHYIFIATILFLQFFLFAQKRSTWKVIQDEVMTPLCADCHQIGTTFSEQSGLLLTEGEAYQQLINVLPNNASARSDGLLRVGSEGLASLETSYLWEKINAPNQEHFNTDHPYYGSLMPLGRPYLTNGQLEFIKQWILGGVPEEGIVEAADESLLRDTTRYEPPEFVELSTPQQGIQLHLGPFNIPPNFEREFYYYQPLDTTGDLYLERVEIIMRSGSHHFIAYTFTETVPAYAKLEPEVYRDIRNSDGTVVLQSLIPTIWHDFGFGTQWPFMNYHFPKGVALRLNADRGLDLNSHYVNRTDSTFVGEVYINMHLAQPEEVNRVAEVLSLNNLEIDLPPNQVTTLEETYLFDDEASVFQLMSHAHEHMVEFRVEKVGGEFDGELVYIAYDWEHPPILELDPPLHVKVGEGLKLSVTYDNWTDETLNFGLLSEDEMMILFGYYYLGSPTLSIDAKEILPMAFDLRENYPNPFNGQTTIEFSLAKEAEISLNVYDMLGRRVASLIDGKTSMGKHMYNWSAKDDIGSFVPSGIYFVRLSIDGESRTKKAVVLR